MAQTYRCPVCGATHKELQDQCRLCGQMLGPDAVVGTPQEGRVEVAEQRGIGGIVFVAVLIVVALVVVAVLLGVVPGIKVLDSAKGKVGINQTADGWSRFDYPAGGFSVEFPEGDRKTKADDGTYSAYMFINKDTLLLVQSKRVMSPEEYQALTQSTDQSQTLKKAVGAAADEIEQALKNRGVKIDKRTDTGYGGVPAVTFELRDAKPEFDGLRADVPIWGREIVFMSGGVLYKISVLSVYKDAEQFDRLLNTFQITGPPGQSTGTTAAP